MKNDVFYNLPGKVNFCKNCVLSNQVPNSVPEFKHTREREGAKYLELDSSGICDACKVSEKKKKELKLLIILMVQTLLL